MNQSATDKFYSYQKEDGNSSVFQESVKSTVNPLCQENISKPFLIWGDFNLQVEGYHNELDLHQKYPQLNNRIYCCRNSKDFRMMAVANQNKNLLFIMSGKFAIDKFGVQDLTNLEWLNSKIIDQTLRSRGFFLLTSSQIMKINNWTQSNLQNKYHYLTIICTSIEELDTALNKTFYNRIYRTLEIIGKIDFFFGTKAGEIIKTSLTPSYESIKSVILPLQNVEENINRLSQYVKTFQLKTPLILHLKPTPIKQFCKDILDCINNSGGDQSISDSILKLYTKENSSYKIINFSINTMNEYVYQIMNPFIKALSIALTNYDDSQQGMSNSITVYRGQIMQIYQYKSLVDTYESNKSQDKQTIVVFPQYTSTSKREQVAQNILKMREEEVKKADGSRVNEGAIELINKAFGDVLKVFVTIQAKINFKNPLRPKNISCISHFKSEDEILFHPFQPFKIMSMDEFKGDDDTHYIKLYYEA